MLEVFLELMEQGKEVNLFLSSTRRWVTRAKITCVDGEIIRFRKKQKDRIIEGITYMDNVTDIATIWSSEVELLNSVYEKDIESVGYDEDDDLLFEIND